MTTRTDVLLGLIKALAMELGIGAGLAAIGGAVQLKRVARLDEVQATKITVLNAAGREVRAIGSDPARDGVRAFLTVNDGSEDGNSVDMGTNGDGPAIRLFGEKDSSLIFVAAEADGGRIQTGTSPSR